ncbi:MAG: Crp/Fnr family transcriptional regulator [Burkholderiaceae bacterium]|jgi:CRP-like cAMP-binding protein|nr:Crp/Fnr family transcriptional regulator [Burkholderiaceae bacterium]
MDDPILNLEEREAINNGRWFSSLSPSLRHDILRCAYVKRFKDGDLISSRGATPAAWIACAKGAVRVCSTSTTGKQVTFSYVEPGIWFGDVAIFDGDRRTHDAYAHGETSLLCVSRADFEKILDMRPELYKALMQLQARRIRQLFMMVEDLSTLPLRARLAKRLNALLAAYGTAPQNRAANGANGANEVNGDGAARIGLQLAQEELAQMLGASRQRVNQELKNMEREQVIRVEPAGLLVRDRAALRRIAEMNQ